MVMVAEMEVGIATMSIVKRHIVGMAMLRGVASCSRSQPTSSIRDDMTNVLYGGH